MEAHTGYLDDEKFISELAANNNLDLAVTEPDFNEEKQDYKKVVNWTSKEKYKGQKINGHQVIIRNSKIYHELDFDFIKYLPVKQAQEIINILPATLTFGRAAAGHALYKVTNTPDDAITIRVHFKDHCINEFRTDGSYSIFYGPLDKEARAEFTTKPIAEIDYQKLKKLFRYQNILAALTMLIGTKNTGEINSLLLAVGGEFYNQEIPEETTVKIINKWHSIIDREDRIKESEACIRGIYKSKKASNIFSKTHFVAIDDKSKHQFRQIVKDLIEKKEEAKAPRDLTSYSLREYMNLGITPSRFMLDRLFKEHSIDFISGPKGQGKTEFVLGVTNALARGLSFLTYSCPEAVPVVYIDGEMDPYDLVERSKIYIERFGYPKDDNYFRIVNYAQQFKETIPDIKSPEGQEKITRQLELTYKLTNKKALLVLDNLRSLSNYKENDSDDYREINSWLLRLRGQKYTIIVIDHHGKGEGGGPRGTSSKTDNANVSLLLNSIREKGVANMVMRIKFDKARGLRPDETEDYEAVYDFAGNWTRQEARTDDSKINTEEVLRAIYEIRIKEHKEGIAAMNPYKKQLEDKLISEKEYYKIEKKVRKGKTQEELAQLLGISKGSINKIIKNEYSAYFLKRQNEEKTSNY